MKIKLVAILILFLIIGCTATQKNTIPEQISETLFPKGEKVDSPNFTGSIWLNMMGSNDNNMNSRYGLVTFEPRARTYWHSHPGGQLLFITNGKGYYQAKGQRAQLLKKGDYVEIPPNVIHWHGATPESVFSHIAVSLNIDKGNVIWLKPVTDDEYLKLNEHKSN